MTAEDDAWGPWRRTPDASGTEKSDGQGKNSDGPELARPNRCVTGSRKDRARLSSAVAVAAGNPPGEHPSAACDLYDMPLVTSDPDIKASWGMFIFRT